MPFRVIFAIFLILAGPSVCAQKTVADSLEHLISSVPSDTTKVWLLNKLVSELREKDNNKAMTLAREAKDLAELLNYKPGLAKALENYGWLLYRKGDYSKSLEISTQAMHASEALGDAQGVATGMINVAAIHYEQKQYRQAIRYFHQAYNRSKIIPDTVIMARCDNNIAYTYFALNELDSADHYSMKAYALALNLSDKYMMAFAKRTIGDVLLSRKDLGKARTSFQQCYRMATELNNNFLKSSVLHRLANTAFQQKKYDDAIRHLEENIAIGNAFGFKDELERAYFLMSKIFFEKKDPIKAYEFQTMYVNLHDTLYNQRSSEQIALMQIRYDTELKQAQIEILTRDAALKSDDIKQQQTWIYVFAACFTLLLILAIVLYQNNRHNRNARISLQEKNREIQSQTRQLKNLNSTKDKLFSIISHDLRSPVASLKALMEIVNTTGLSQEEFVEITKVLKRNLDTVYDDLDNLLFWAQTQLRGLQVKPEAVDLRRIADEKIEFFNEQLNVKNIVVVNEIPPAMMVMADRNHLGLVFRNLLANAIKFNKDFGTITLSTSEKDGFCQVSISDSGVGINKEDILKLFNAETHFTKPGTRSEKGVGIGLLLTKEFVEKNNGAIWVASEPGKGATFTFTVKASQQMELTAVNG
jgi:two-component system, sensor histidine kinase and response regulator